MDFHAISWDFMPSVCLLWGISADKPNLFCVCSTRFAWDNPVDKVVSFRIGRDSQFRVDSQFAQQKHQGKNIVPRMTAGCLDGLNVQPVGISQDD